MGNKVKDNREEKRIGVFNSLNSGIDFKGAFHTYEQETILKAMQEYADLRCKEMNGRVAELEKEVERLKGFLFYWWCVGNKRQFTDSPAEKAKLETDWQQFKTENNL